LLAGRDIGPIIVTARRRRPITAVPTIIAAVPRRVAPNHNRRAPMLDMRQGYCADARGRHDLSRRRNRRPDHRRRCHDPPRRRDRSPAHWSLESAMEGCDRAPNKGAAPGGRLNRRPAHRKNDEDAGRNSNGHHPCSACAVNGPHPIPPHPPVPGSVAVFCGPDFSLIFTPREGCDEPQGLSDECGAFSVHCGLIATCVSEFSRCDRL
jgi:hypothetical protein